METQRDMRRVAHILRLVGATIAPDGEHIDGAHCGCPECSTSVRPGHFACETVADALLDLEDQGVIYRSYDDGAWRWFIAAPRSRLSAALRDYTDR